MQNPSQYKIPNWFLNRQKDIKDGKYSQVIVFQFLKLRLAMAICLLNVLSDQFRAFVQ